MNKQTRKRNGSASRPGYRAFNRKADNRINMLKMISGNIDAEQISGSETGQAFNRYGLHTALESLISRSGYQTATEIQDKTIPQIISGKDLIGVAGTGTGKTAAFLIPVINGLIDNKETDRALVLTPTRELASQINSEFRKLSKGLDLYSTVLIGGTSVRDSIRSLQRRNHIVIATPGRLIDMHQRGHIRLDRFKMLVLDEFDRMLDMGFKDAVKQITGQMKGRQQTLLFSATMDQSQKELIRNMTSHPVLVTAESGKQVTRSISQELVFVRAEESKSDVLYDLLSGQEHERVLLFCDTKRLAGKVRKNLQWDRIPSDMIHGDMTQRAREVALKKFKKGQVKVLVATDVVARGIDVEDVSLVINYAVPQDYNSYVHRIGRTGRAGKSGKAITLVD